MSWCTWNIARLLRFFAIQRLKGHPFFKAAPGCRCTSYVGFGPTLLLHRRAGFAGRNRAAARYHRYRSAKDNNIRIDGLQLYRPDIMKALIAAKRRGVDVKIVVDENGNTGRASRAAMNLVTNAGIPLRVNSNYKIQHDKVIIVDGRHVETGSFNYTASAEKYNSENAIVMWDAPELAGQYLKHWQSRWNQGRDFTRLIEWRTICLICD